MTTRRLRDRFWNRVRTAPLRLRLIGLLGSLLTIAAVATGVTASVLLRHYLVQRQDAELTAATSTLVDRALDETQADVDSVLPAPQIVPVSVYVVRLAWPGGRVHDVYTVAGRSPQWPAPDGPAHADPVTVDGTDGSDEQWRLVSGTTTDKHGRQVRYAVAVSLSEVERTVHRMQALVAGTGLIVIPASMILGWFLVRRSFRPLAAIEDTAAAIAHGDLTRRVPLQSSRDEVGSLSKSLNTMLGHIETSFGVREASEARMRRFVADASHELRTPLATVRGYAELYRQGAVRDPEDVAAAMRRIEDEATRMGVLVDDLLLLARLERDSPGAQRPFGPVDLTVLGMDAVQDARVLAPERSIRLLGLGGAVGPVPVDGDESRLRQVVTNLVTNAIRYTPRDSPIEVRVGLAGDHAELQVRDHGPGIPSELRDKVFERFYRADASRNSARGGSGLGLAIADTIAGAHGGRVRVESTPGGGATFVLSLPAARSGADPDTD